MPVSGVLEFCFTQVYVFSSEYFEVGSQWLSSEHICALLVLLGSAGQDALLLSHTLAVHVHVCSSIVL